MKIAVPALFLLTCCNLPAQTPAAFEVASVRPSAFAGKEPNVETAPGSLTIRGTSLRSSVQWAYDMPPFQFNGPAWLDDTGFDMAAKASGPVNVDQLRLMLRTLLAERFGLKVHMERREMQIYALTLAKGGPKFHESVVGGEGAFTNEGKGALIASHVTMSELAWKISEPLGRPVIDATGLKGRYDIKIDVTAYSTENENGKGAQLDVMSILFNALQAQLGVKLEGRRDTVDILTVDHVEKTPSEN